jgi:hypothetical protein
MSLPADRSASRRRFVAAPDRRIAGCIAGFIAAPDASIFAEPRRATLHFARDRDRAALSHRAFNG